MTENSDDWSQNCPYGYVLYTACAFWSLLAYLKNKCTSKLIHTTNQRTNRHTSQFRQEEVGCATLIHITYKSKNKQIFEIVPTEVSGPQRPRGLWWTSVPLEVSQKVHKCIPVPILKEPQRQYRSCCHQTQAAPANHRQNLRAGWKQG